MKRHRAYPVWLTGWLLALAGSSLVLAVDFATNAESNAVFAKHLARLKVPEGFTVVAQPPFVVIGDEPPAQVRMRATNTVKWAVDRLKQDYFPRDQAETIDIWLFRDRESYTNHARLLFNDTPTKFYREFVGNAKRDPTVFNTLKCVLDEADLAAFQKKWEKLVLTLRKSEDW